MKSAFYYDGEVEKSFAPVAAIDIGNVSVKLMLDRAARVFGGDSFEQLRECCPGLFGAVYGLDCGLVHEADFCRDLSTSVPAVVRRRRQ